MSRHRPLRRSRLTFGAVVAAEGCLYWRYAAYGALFHYWLHTLAGATAALAVLAALRLARPSRRPDVWGWGLAGHVWSAAPDIVFVLAGILHRWWMDVFALHITVHFTPAPLLTAFLTFSLTLLAWVAAAIGRRRVAAGALAAAAAVAAAALLLRTPPPVSLEQLRASPQLALLCPLAEPDGYYRGSWTSLSVGRR